MQDRGFEKCGDSFVKLICAVTFLFQTQTLLLNRFICLYQVVPRTEVTKKLWEYIKAKKSDAKKWLTTCSSGSYVMLNSVEGVDVF